MIKGLKHPTVRGMSCWLVAALFLGTLSACTQATDMGIPTASDSQAASQTETTPAAEDPDDAALTYSQCMRENGVPEFPDADAEGRIMMRAGPDSSLNPDSAEFQEAAEACRHLQPAGRAGANGGIEGQETMLEFARCMRENGVPDYPDPDPNAGPGVRIVVGPNSDLDPNDPKVQDALEICEAILQKEVGGETE